MSIFNISSYQPKKEEKYFLDCNVLMYTFYTNGGYASDIVYDYSLLITKIVNAQAEILVTDVLLSEFVNTYIQTEFHRLASLNRWPHSKQYFKHSFKFSTEYKDILRELKVIITRQIAPIATMADISFSQFICDTLFDFPETFDFNDRYYGYAMAPYNALIVTNDADFSNVTQCNVITRNTTLLAV